jgi:hypothetical protein
MLVWGSKIALGQPLSTRWCGWQKALCSLTLAFDWPNRMINPSALFEVVSSPFTILVFMFVGVAWETISHLVYQKYSWCLTQLKIELSQYLKRFDSLVFKDLFIYKNAF